MSELIESRRMNRGQGGFTLIELLVVIAILAILAGIAAFAVGGLTDDANENACKTELDTAKTAAEAYAATHDGTYPADETELLTHLNQAPKYWNYSLSGAGLPVFDAAQTPAVC